MTIEDMPAHPVLVIMGVSGCGKSSVAKGLVDRLGWDLIEGDDLHPVANRDKMAAGVPLTDEDRQPWLETVADWIGGQINADRPGVVTCSALRRRYRDLLRTDATVFVHLHGSRELLAERMAARKDHFMPTSRWTRNWRPSSRSSPANAAWSSTSMRRTRRRSRRSSSVSISPRRDPLLRQPSE